MKIRQNFGIAVLLFVAISGSVQADLLSNGSFENSSGGIPNDWSASGNMNVISSQGVSEGSFALAFSHGNLPSTGEIFQSFVTVAGATYQVRFDFGKYAVNQPTQVARLELNVFDGAGTGGTNLLNETVEDVSSQTSLADVYDSLNFQFTASGSSTTIQFVDSSDPQSASGGFDAMLDNVSVNAIPEPASMAVLSIVFLIATRRRRRNESS